MAIQLHDNGHGIWNRMTGSRGNGLAMNLGTHARPLHSLTDREATLVEESRDQS